MKKRKMLMWSLSASFFFLFLLLTVLLTLVDVKPCGALSSSVGLAGINSAFDFFYTYRQIPDVLSDCLLYLSIGVAVALSLICLVSVIRAKGLSKVKRDVYALLAVYTLIVASYIVFDIWTVNSRPILIDGSLEASFPSTHVTVVLTVMASAIRFFNTRIEKRNLKMTIVITLSVIMLLSLPLRLLSGVHWFTDILGAALLSVAIVFAYYALCEQAQEKGKKHTIN